MGLRRLFAITCGHIDMDRGLFRGGERRVARTVIPVAVFLAEHDRGLALIDTGMHPKCMTDAVGHWGRLARHALLPLYGPGEDPASRLREIGFDPHSVQHILLSHLHNDHAGCNTLFPSAKFYVQAAEWDYAISQMREEYVAYVADDFQHPLSYQLLDGELDLFGDGSVVAVKTHGHTAGHQSVLVRLPESGTVVLTGDAVYTREAWDSGSPPPVVWNQDLATRSVLSLRDIVGAERGQAFIGHDPDDWTAPPIQGSDFVLMP